MGAKIVTFVPRKKRKKKVWDELAVVIILPVIYIGPKVKIPRKKKL